MSLFQQSGMTFALGQARVAEIADSSGDADQLTKAGYAIQAALEYWNNRYNWNYLRNIGLGIAIIAPYTVVSATTTDSTTVTSAALFGDGTTVVRVGDIVSGTGIIAETTVVTVTDTSHITLSRAATATGAATLTFGRSDYALPADFKQMYTARTVVSPRKLFPLNANLYDAISSTQTITGLPEAYSLFPQGGVGKIRLYPPPSTADTLIIKYQRRMTIPTTGSETLDIPQDYEFSLLALAKGLYLADKGGNEVRQAFWTKFGEAGLSSARAVDRANPDEDLAFQPAQSLQTGWNPNSLAQNSLDPWSF
jgi:hypothetical protein